MSTMDTSGRIETANIDPRARAVESRDAGSRATADGVRARKRAALGLSPNRPTAQSRVARPPDPAQRSWAVVLLPIGLLGIIGVTLLLMFEADYRPVALQLQPDWSWARLAPADSPLETPGAQIGSSPSSVEAEPVTGPLLDTSSPGGTGSAAPAVDVATENQAGQVWPGGVLTPHLRLTDNFSGPETVFSVQRQAGQWHTEHLPHLASYRMEVWPHHLVWSLLESEAGLLHNDQAYRVQAAATVAGHTPGGYAGLIARVDEGRQLILFAVDGKGRYSIQHLRDGLPQIAIPWTAADALNPAGTGNVLTIEDEGETMRFFANQLPLYQMRTADWQPGLFGIAAGARGEGVAEIRFEWFQLYELTEREELLERSGTP